MQQYLQGAPQHLAAFQAICGQCHLEKTTKEPRASVCILRSRFSKRVWKAYVESPPPPCMNYKDASVAEHPLHRDPVKSHKAVDVICSRRAALYYTPDIPIFTPMDDIEPITPAELPDIIFVSKQASQMLGRLNGNSLIPRSGLKL